MTDETMNDTPPRATLAEALADTPQDWFLFGSIYIIRLADGTYQRLDPSRVRYDTRGYEVGGAISRADSNVVDESNSPCLAMPYPQSCRACGRGGE